jgi:hypothetical protein
MTEFRIIARTLKSNLQLDVHETHQQHDVQYRQSDTDGPKSDLMSQRVLVFAHYFFG